MKVVTGQFEAVNSRDFKAVMEAYAEDVELVLHDDLRGGGGEGALGKEAVGKWFGDWFQQFDSDYRFEVEEARDLGDRVFVVATHHGHGRSSGIPVEQRTAYLYAVADGRVNRVDVWTDREAALEAAGLSE